ncbi:hypothetical protein CERSUDRAFT_160868 [Gelatoporia subvermispora B]|uniref:Uncharacterized protein n=1 Tax=Ceriporiopsis subvermispora (strain B) TaxID=914234 RepID=M2QM79_CERS8|nr:hypothetical protein CERSUDRAFT_160868 [Gelatoporia subvermispora B]
MFASRPCLRNVRHFWTRSSLRTTSLQRDSLQAILPLYARKTPWWARWTWFIVAADLVTTAAAVELTWHYWTEQVTDSSSDASDAKTPEGQVAQPAKHFELRPVWQRALFAGGQLFLGVALATLLLGTRARIVHKVTLLPPSSATTTTTATNAHVTRQAAPARPASPKQSSSTQAQSAEDGRQVLIQSVSHLGQQGILRPFRDCNLVRGQREEDMAVEVAGMRGQFVMELEGAEINGEAMPVWKARETMWKGWYGDQKGRQFVMEERLQS